MFFPDDPERPEEWEILIRLTGLCAGTPAEDIDVAAIDDGFFDYLCFTLGLDGAQVRSHYSSCGPERILDLTLRTGPFGDRIRPLPRPKCDGRDALAYGPIGAHRSASAASCFGEALS